MANYKTGAQRYNDKMDKIYQKAKNSPYYNPNVHGELTRDKVVSITSRGQLVGVYWKGANGASVLFETSPQKADKIIKIFNSK